jgi:hypothetical protein
MIEYGVESNLNSCWESSSAMMFTIGDLPLISSAVYQLLDNANIIKMFLIHIYIHAKQI